MEKYYNYINKKLSDRLFSGNLRNLKIIPSGRIDFSSNDFLGYSKNGLLRSKIEELKPSIDMSYVGSTGSRLITGNSLYIENVEDNFSQLINSKSALFFNSGYMANLAVLSSLSDKNSLMLYDENAHASIKDGIRNGIGKRFSFKHNSIIDLESKLEKYSKVYERVFIVTEGLFSMDGDIPDLNNFLALCAKFDAALIIDEAHSLGTCGKRSLGISNDYYDHPHLFARIYPFGKAAGTQGAFVCGSKILIDFFQNFSRPFIYTTAPTVDQVLSVQAAIELFNNRTNFDQLQTVISEYLELQAKGNLSNCSNNKSPIQYFRSADISYLEKLVDELRSNSIAIFPIFAPSVRKGEERLRIILHSYNTQAELKLLMDILN